MPSRMMPPWSGSSSSSEPISPGPRCSVRFFTTPAWPRTNSLADVELKLFRLGASNSEKRLDSPTIKDAVDQIADAQLHLMIGGGLLLADQEGGFVGQCGATVDCPHDGVDEIVAVQIWLPVGDVAREQIGGRPPLKDSGDLLGDEGRPAILVIDAGKAEDGNLDVATVLVEQRRGVDLGLGIGPAWVDRRLFVDHAFFGARSVHQHRAGRNKNSLALPEDERFELNLPDIAEVWRRGSVISSWLLDLTAQALAADPRLDQFTAAVADSGEGRWTIEAALEEAVPADVLAAAVFARFRSRDTQVFGEKLLSAMRSGFGGHVEEVA